MSKRLLTSLPIFGLSALAIGAPIPHDGIAETRVQNDVFRQKAMVMRNDAASPEIHPLRAQRSLSRKSLTSVVTRESHTKHAAGKSKLARAAISVKQEDNIRDGMTAAANAVPHADPFTSAGKSPAPDIRASLGVTETAKVAPKVQAQPAQFAATPVARTMNRPAPSSANGALKIPVPTNRDPVIYGTSASNAYKVYFPQEGIADVGRLTDTTLINSQPAASDTRVLQKKGSYLFYEDAPTPAETAQKPHEMTAPVLQKQPLDFSNTLFQRSVQPDNAAPSDPGRTTAR